ncbi:MAG: Uncharacterized protein G01um101420_224 [Parcubacteria group bacterium Gr01-1014_20]|nr:MAG: Uncharacterized protein G01um101420_224 [Parcubacteria group bacterium Gr01-1014_20]
MGKILNFEKLAVTTLRKKALAIAEAGFDAIDTKRVVEQNVRLSGNSLLIKNEVVNLDKTRRIRLVGFGKCAIDAAKTLESILGHRLSGGIILDVRDGQLKKVEVIHGDHPLPTERNADATKKIIEFLKDSNEDDLIIFIVSGGGTTLLCQPDKMTCQEEADIVRCLFSAGASIEKMNILRKHLSYARGGFLAKYAYPAKTVALIFSDVPGDNLNLIASGATIKDTSTIEDAKKIIAEFKLNETCGFKEDNLIETPKEEKYFENSKNIILVSNEVALRAMAEKARELGLKATIRDAHLAGEAIAVGRDIVEKLAHSPKKTAFLYGGETAVTKIGKGKGGRNLELALSALRFIKPEQIIVTIASDGQDNSDFAGGICDIITREKATSAGLVFQKYLGDNESYAFFEKTGQYLKTGHTGSNVSDLIIAINQ